MSFRSPKSKQTANTSLPSDPPNIKQDGIAFEEYEGSEFDPSEEAATLKNKQNKHVFPIVQYKPSYEDVSTRGLPSKEVLNEARMKADGQVRAFHFMSMNAYSKHKKLCNDYIRFYSKGKTFEEVFKRDTSKDKTDLDVIREKIKFVWEDDEDQPDTWEMRLAKKYYDKLFKEYCICDLILYKQNKIAMRWRIEKEVIAGKGQFICGDKRCSARDGLKSWEVNFAYAEHNEKKNALVKLRVCPDCSCKLNYHHKKKEIIKKPKNSVQPSDKKFKQKSQTKQSDSSSSESDEESIKYRPQHKKQKSKESEESAKTSKKEEGETKEGNMIILGDSSDMWKTNLETGNLLDESKTREDDFENYLEDLLL